jgi:hypothetical protein
MQGQPNMEAARPAIANVIDAASRLMNELKP